MELDPEAQQLWEINARWWQDGFTDGADAEYEEQILPLAAEELGVALEGARATSRPGRVVDIGCGEGQIARLAGRLGAGTVVGVDPTESQLLEARIRGGPVGLIRAVAADLPLSPGSFDVAVACLVFEHIEAMDRAVAEVGRVLRPGGTFLLFLNHPLLQTPGSGWIDDTILEEQYWRIGPYLVEDARVEEVDKDVWIPFVHRPLSRYVNALAAAGMYVTRMVEPAPPPGFLARASEYEAAATIPRLLFVRAVKSTV
jgi:SAM-dependent methyltransferase